MVKSSDVNDPFDYQININTVAINGEYYTNSDLVIPEEVEINGIKYTVTAINNDAFKYNEEIKSIKIPATITFIGSLAFNKCNKLKRVDFLGEKPTIEKDAFLFAGTGLNPPIGYVNNELESWKGINVIDNGKLVIKNKLYNIKLILSIIICVILFYILTITNTSIWFKLPLYILIILFSHIFFINLIKFIFDIKITIAMFFIIILDYIIINLSIGLTWKIILSILFNLIAVLLYIAVNS